MQITVVQLALGPSPSMSFGQLKRFPLDLTHTLRHARPTGSGLFGRPGCRPVPGIHVCAPARKTWMAGTSPRLSGTFCA